MELLFQMQYVIKYGLFYYDEQGVELASCVYECLEEDKDAIHIWRKSNIPLEVMVCINVITNVGAICI